MKTTVTIKCQCGASFEDIKDSEWNFPLNDSCAKCREIEHQKDAIEKANKEAQRRLEEIKKQLDDATPSRFQSTDTNHPSFNSNAYRKAQAWKPSQEKQWLGFVGATGLCKTRIAHRIANRILIDLVESDNQKMIDLVQAGDDSKIYSDKLPTFLIVAAYDIRSAILASTAYDDRDQKKDAEKLLARAMKADLLMLDDLGKGRLTPAVAEGFYKIIDHRHVHDLVTIWTANSKPIDIAAMLPQDMQADMGGALAGRLISSSTIHHFA
jgi:DNA replication protein DnaC